MIARKAGQSALYIDASCWDQKLLTVLEVDWVWKFTHLSKRVCMLV